MHVNIVYVIEVVVTCTDVCRPRPANTLLCCERDQSRVVSWLEASPPCSQVIS